MKVQGLQGCCRLSTGSIQWMMHGSHITGGSTPVIMLLEDLLKRNFPT